MRISQPQLWLITVSNCGCALIGLMLASFCYGQRPEQQPSSPGSVTWKIDNLKKIGGHQIKVLSN